MNRTIEDLYQAIGHEAIEAAVDLSGSLLIYAEVSDGGMSADLFYEQGPERVLTFKFCSDVLCELIRWFWQSWQDHPGNEAWRSMTYTVENGKFGIDLVYADQLEEDEAVFDRRADSDQQVLRR